MTPRDQRIWDGIYAAAWAGILVRPDGATRIITDEQFAEVAFAARSIADRGLKELRDCKACDGSGLATDNPGPFQTVYDQTCFTCGGTGRKP